MSDTHFSALQGKRRTRNQTLDGPILQPREGEFFYDTQNNQWAVFQGGVWWFQAATTTTSTSTSTTTTSTSTTTTSTSTSSSTSTSTSSTTSTTTTL